MAAAPQKQALEVIKTRVMNVDERYEGYRRDLIATLHDILAYESDRPHNIAQKISRRVSALGETLIQKKGNIE